VEWITGAVAAFVLIVPVELPDKTFVAALVLSTRYPPVPVWVGVVAAFGVQCAVAVAAGRLVSLLPDRPVQLVAAGLFLIGAIVLLHGARRADRDTDNAEREYEGKVKDTRSGVRAAMFSFIVLFTAEWGDLSQILTASLVAAGRPAIPVFVGSWAGLATVSGAAVLIGRALLKRVRLSLIRFVGAGVCGALAAITTVAAFT
jgi:putative Ca2+/H+ antiporter (TMEM165/GDT1 family)